jgi:hypothetical protein
MNHVKFLNKRANISNLNNERRRRVCAVVERDVVEGAVLVRLNVEVDEGELNDVVGVHLDQPAAIVVGVVSVRIVRRVDRAGRGRHSAAATCII